MQSKTTFSSLAIASYYIIAAGVISGGRFGGELVDRLGVGVHDGANLDAPSSLSRR